MTATRSHRRAARILAAAVATLTLIAASSGCQLVTTWADRNDGLADRMAAVLTETGIAETASFDASFTSQAGFEVTGTATLAGDATASEVAAALDEIEAMRTDASDQPVLSITLDAPGWSSSVSLRRCDDADDRRRIVETAAAFGRDGTYRCDDGEGSAAFTADWLDGLVSLLDAIAPARSPAGPLALVEVTSSEGAALPLHAWLTDGSAAQLAAIAPAVDAAAAHLEAGERLWMWVLGHQGVVNLNIDTPLDDNATSDEARLAAVRGTHIERACVDAVAAFDPVATGSTLACRVQHETAGQPIVLATAPATA